MSYIADTRSKTRISPYRGDTGEQNSYWEGYLKEDDARYILGYDTAEEEAVLALMDKEAFVRAAERSKLPGFNPENIDQQELLEEKRLDNCTVIEKKAMSPETKFAKALAEEICDRLEIIRHTSVVSLIEAIDEDEYDRIVKEAGEDKYKNCIIRRKEQDAERREEKC